MISLLHGHMASRPTTPALFTVRQGEAINRTWSELGDAVHRCAHALSQAGVRPGDRVVQWSENRAEWIITDLAIICLQAIHVPIHATISGSQAMAQMLHSGARVIIISGRNQWNELAPLVKQLPTDAVILSHDKIRRWSGDVVPSLSEAVDNGDPQIGAELANRAIAEADPHAIATILYTSGTTGEPKGIALSHDNLRFNAQTVVEMFGEQPMEIKLCFLPFSHIFGRTCDIYTWLVRGAQIALAQNRDTIIDDCKRFSPTMINGVPYFFERVHHKLVEKGIADQPGSLQRVFGGGLRGCCSGGGALSEETFDFFARHEIPLLQGYGLTESSPVISFNLLDANKRGTVGRPMRGVEVRIADDGEILTRGRHVMVKYWQDEQATRETIKDGWLHTGDLGEMDEEGYLRITGRKKEMIKTATGKMVFPAHLESLLCRDPLIIQAFVVGDGRKCLAALIVPDPDVLKAEIKNRRIRVFSKKGAVRHPRVCELYRQRIDSQLAGLSRHEQIAFFTILDRGFTFESGHLTPKLSLRRDAILRDYEKQINAMYSTAPLSSRTENVLSE